MSVEVTGLYDLCCYASFDRGSRLSSAVFTESSNYIYGFLFSENKKINFCHIPKHRKEDKLKEETKYQTVKLRQLQWFSNESLQVRHASFNPLGDYCLLLTDNMSLYVVCVATLLQDNLLSTSSGLAWNKETVTSVFRSDADHDHGTPTCVHWWETSDFIQMGIIGTSLGHMVLVNLISGTIVSKDFIFNTQCSQLTMSRCLVVK